MGALVDAAACAAAIKTLSLIAEPSDLHFAPSVYVGPSGHVYIHMDEGRLVRPLLVAPVDFDALRPGESIEELLRMRMLRYVDASESFTLDIQIDPLTKYDDALCDDHDERRFDLAEIHPVLMLGVTASSIPLLQCIQGPTMVCVVP